MRLEIRSRAGRGPGRPRPPLLFVFLIGGAFALAVLISSHAYAFPVPPLPEGNLLENPWFRSQADPTLSGLDGWTDAAGVDEDWSSSQKASNPTADEIVSGVCGPQELFCGTAARLSATAGQSGGVGEIGADAYLYQVVAANPVQRRLRFFAHWVSHRIEPAEVVIYGGTGENGPWSELWVPFHHVQEEVIVPPSGDPKDLWTSTGMVELDVVTGYPYYKIEIHARLPEGDGPTGFKMTGVYFATSGNVHTNLLPAIYGMTSPRNTLAR